jgi:hypothetical protein
MKNLNKLHDFLDSQINKLKCLLAQKNTINYHFLEPKTSFNQVEIFLN